MAESILKTIREYFGMTMPEFRAQWTKLTATDKAQIRQAFENGSLTY